MRQVVVEYDNLELTLIGQFYEGDDCTYMYPASSSDFNLCEVLHGGEDIIDILSDTVLTDLEIEAIKEIEQQERDYDSTI
jgi:hypothetical protein